MNNDHIFNAAETIFATGTMEQRDALRTIANTVLSGKAAFEYEDCALDTEATYRVLEEMKFSGDGKQMLPADEVVSLDSILHKSWRKNFFSAVANMALTMHCTDPATVGQGYWPKDHYKCGLLVHRAFLWMVSTHGLLNLLSEKAAHKVSHTRLPQFIVAFQIAGKDEGHARHYTMYHPEEDAGTINVNNVLPDSYKEQLIAKSQANRPEEYDSVPHLSFNELIELCERLNVIGPNSATTSKCNCEIDDECDCDEDDDEVMTRSDFDPDEIGDLRDHFWQKFGYPDDEPDMPDEDIWIPGVSQMEVQVDLPTVRLETQNQIAPRSGMKMKSRAQKSACKRQMVLLSPAQQIWHELDNEKEFGDRSFAITLVSRSTCGVNRAVATTREALAIATALMDASK